MSGLPRRKPDRRVGVFLILLALAGSVLISAFAVLYAVPGGQQFICYGEDACAKQCTGVPPRFSWCPRRGEAFRHVMGWRGCIC